MAGHPLQRLRHVDKPVNPFIRLIEVGELLGQLQRILQGNVQGRWHQLSHHIHLGIGHVQRPAHIPNGGPGCHGAEGDDLGHMVVAVLAADVVHHLAPAGVSEVHIDIRHGYPLRIQEALKIQMVLHGVDVRDVQTVGDHAPRRRASARSHGDTGILGVSDEIRHDEEIIRKAHASDHVQLVVQLAAVFLMLRAVALGEPLFAQLPQIGGRIYPRRQPELRQMILAEGKLHPAAVGDALGVGYGVGIGAEQLLHLLRGAEVEVSRLVAHPVLVVHGLARLDAQQHIVALGVLRPQVVGVVGADQRDARLLMDAEQIPVHQRLLGDTVILQLQIEVILPEDLLHGQGVLLSPVVVAVYQSLGDLPGQTGRQGDEALAVLAQQVQIDAGLDVKALHKCLTHHVRQVPVARLVFTQQHQMPGLGVIFMNFVEPGAAGHIHLAPDDRMDALCFAGPVEVDGSVHDPVVGDGHRRLAHFPDAGRKVPDAAGTVQQAVFRMHMKMHKSHSYSFLRRRFILGCFSCRFVLSHLFRLLIFGPAPPDSHTAAPPPRR